MQENKVIRLLARPELLFFLMPWLMFVLVYGTVIQRYIGIYEAERLYFSSFVIWLGPVPLPGMYIILGLLSVSLIAKLILKSPWTRKTSGTVITHIGALLLLLGGMMTAFSNEEGFMTLGQHEELSVVTDYHQRELAILKNEEELKSIPIESLSNGQVITGLPFKAVIDDFCRHCVPSPRKYVNESHKGIAAKLKIEKAPLRKEDEENQFGASFTISDADEDIDGQYIAFEVAPHQPTIEIGDDTYQIIARKAQRDLPFKVRLESFKKYSYPGTDIAEEYESIITIIDGELEWQTPIRMNEPVRHKGYTLYQSSFFDNGVQEFSVLAVVKNAGRVFPYISSIVMCIGLLIHIMVRRKK